MRNYANPKLKLLYLKQFFEECTDEDHPATMPQILEYLDSKGIHAERKGIYKQLMQSVHQNRPQERSGPDRSLIGIYFTMEEKKHGFYTGQTA